MSHRIAKRWFSVDEYYRTAEAGILTEDDRVELIEGEIVEISPIGSRPLDKTYSEIRLVKRGEALVSQAVSNLTLEADSIFG